MQTPPVLPLKRAVRVAPPCSRRAPSCPSRSRANPRTLPLPWGPMHCRRLNVRRNTPPAITCKGTCERHTHARPRRAGPCLRHRHAVQHARETQCVGRKCGCQAAGAWRHAEPIRRQLKSMPCVAGAATDASSGSQGAGRTCRQGMQGIGKMCAWASPGRHLGGSTPQGAPSHPTRVAQPRSPAGRRAAGPPARAAQAGGEAADDGHLWAGSVAEMSGPRRLAQGTADAWGV